MDRPRVHLIAHGSSVAGRLIRHKLGDVSALCSRVAQALGGGFAVTADPSCLTAAEDDRHGGRIDDLHRARDIQRALSDNRVSAIVALAGGAWCLRILLKIDFDVLRRRRERIHVIGSSEMTSLVNIAGRYRRAVGIHDAMAMFLLDTQLPRREAFHQFDSYWADVARIITGRRSSRGLTGTLVSGRLPREGTVRVVGGNLTVAAALMGGPFAKAIRTTGRWLALEDVHEKPERLDRMLAQLRLAGVLDPVEGILLGDFRRGDDDLHDAVLALLRFHLPSRRIPVVGRCNFGHIWPVAPLPLNRPLQMIRQGDEVRIGTSIGHR
jgi:muramoyltetrapeptide carboxypeptidase